MTTFNQEGQNVGGSQVNSGGEPVFGEHSEMRSVVVAGVSVTDYEESLRMQTEGLEFQRRSTEAYEEYAQMAAEAAVRTASELGRIADALERIAELHGVSPKV